MKKSISFLGYLKIPYEQYKSVSFLFDLMQILVRNCSYYDFMMSLYQSSMENNDRIELNYLNGLKNIFYFTF